MSCIEQQSLFSVPTAPVAELPPAGLDNAAIAVEPFSRITEISLSSAAHLSRSVLVGLIAELSCNSDPRWLCWVADRPLKPLMTDTAQADSRILQVVNRPGEAQHRIAVRALESGRSHTVAVLMDQTISDSEKNMLERAAQAGNAECLLIYLQH